MFIKSNNITVVIIFVQCYEIISNMDVIGESVVDSEFQWRVIRIILKDVGKQNFEFILA